MTSIVIFGAGAIGRGFVGALFGAAGWRITFIDVDTALVDRLNADGGYRVVEVSHDGERPVPIDQVGALAFADGGAVAEALAGADLAAVAVGAANLPQVAIALARGLEARARAGAGPLDVLVCENLPDAPAVLTRHATAALAGPAVALGAAHTAIGRMVPVPVPGLGEPTDVRVEPYAFLPYEARAFTGPRPEVPGLVPITGDFAMYDDRKLFVHNMGHCMLAYLGERRGHAFIWQAVADVELRYLVRGAMIQATEALSTGYRVPAGPLAAHVDDLLARFGNAGLADTTERVGRDPLRKMQPDDRMLGAYRACREAGNRPTYLAVAVALGAARLVREDGWDAARVARHLDAALGTADPGRPLIDRAIESLGRGLSVDELVRLVDGVHLADPTF